MAVSAAAKDLLKGVRESVSLIDRLPKDDNGRLRSYDAADDGVESKHFVKPSHVFRQFTFKELRALSVVTQTPRRRQATKRVGRRSTRCL